MSNQNSTGEQSAPASVAQQPVPQPPASAARATASAPLPAAAQAARPARAVSSDSVPPLARFRSGNPDDRLRDLLAFAIAHEEGKPIGPEGLEALHRRADSELSAHAVRYLHNRIEEIRREAQEELRARTRRPASFLKLVLANLIGFLLGTGVLFYALWHLGGLD